MFYYSFDGERGVAIWVERDNQFISVMLKEEISFMESLRDFIPPDPCDADWVEDNDWSRLEAARIYRELQEQQDDIEQQKLRLRNILTQTPHPRAKIGCMKVQKVRRKGNVDYSGLKLYRV